MYDLTSTYAAGEKHSLAEFAYARGYQQQHQ